MKKWGRFLALFLALVFIAIMKQDAYAYTQPDCVVSDVVIDKANQVVGYNDSINLSCIVTSEYDISKVVFWIRSNSKNISFEMTLDSIAGKYAYNLLLDESMLETEYSSFMVDVYYIKGGQEKSYTAYGESDFVEQSFMFNNECKTGNHVFDNGVITSESTCNKKGVTTYTCTVCKEKKEVEIDIMEHEVVKDKAVPATYSKTGLTEGSHCASCGKILVKQNVVPKLKKVKQVISVKKSSYSYKSSQVKQKKIIIKVGAKNSVSNKLKYTVSKYPDGGKKYISVKNGVITIKKNAKKGSYAVTITAPGTTKYIKAEKVIKIKIK